MLVCVCALGVGFLLVGAVVTAALTQAVAISAALKDQSLGFDI